MSNQSQGPKTSIAAIEVVATAPPAGADDSSVIGSSLRRLRAAITSGEFKPGQKLIEAQLCRSFGISRPTLREALRSLAAERLVELELNRGPVVAKLGSREIEDIHDVWAMLTGEAIWRFSAIASDSDLAVLGSALASSKAAIHSGSVTAQIEAIDSFFRYILSRCGNEVLVDVVASLVSRILFLRLHALQQRGWGLLCLDEMSDLLDKIVARDANAARAAALRHIGSACQAARQSALVTEERGKAVA